MSFSMAPRTWWKYVLQLFVTVSLLSVKNKTVHLVAFVWKERIRRRVAAARTLQHSGRYDVVYMGFDPTLATPWTRILKSDLRNKHHEWAACPFLTEPSPAAHILSFLYSVIMSSSIYRDNIALPQFCLIHSGAAQMSWYRSQWRCGCCVGIWIE